MSDAHAPFDDLEYGPAYSFAEFPTLSHIPRSGAAVYTIWDAERRLIYVGVSGRSTTSTTGPWGRLRSHYTGRRSGDQFCVYVADHYVLPRLSRRDVEAIADDPPRLLMDDLVAAHVRQEFFFRFARVPDYRTALAVEESIKAGGLNAGPPRLNPPRRRPRG